MSYQIIRSEISTMAVDAIVEMDDSAQQREHETIHKGFGISVAELGRISPSFAYIKPKKYMGHVLHVVGSKWGQGEWQKWEERRMARRQAKFYQDVLTTALQQSCCSVAMPILSSTSSVHPDQQARQVAEETVEAFLQEHDQQDTMEVYLVLPPVPDKSIFTKVNTYIDENYEGPFPEERQKKWRYLAELEKELDAKGILTESDCQALAEAQQQVKEVYRRAEATRAAEQRFAPEPSSVPHPKPQPSEVLLPTQEDVPEPPDTAARHLQEAPPLIQWDAPESTNQTWKYSELPEEDLDWLKNKPKNYVQESKRVRTILKKRDLQLLPEVKEAILNREEAFGPWLQKLIASTGQSNSDCCNGAHLSRQVFWKICNEPTYNTSKRFLVPIAVQLKLSLEKTEELLRRKGLAFSDSILFDVVVKSCIINGVQDFDEINAQLEAVGEQPLGSRDE